MHGKHMLKSFSRTQSNIALSSAEAELYAFVTAASEGIGMTTMARDFGREIKAHLHVDASAAIGIAQRKGLGRVRHLDTQALWIQDAVRSRRVVLEKVLGTENPADLMTKHLDQKSLDKMLGKMSVEMSEGRAVTAPKLNHEENVASLDQVVLPKVSWADMEDSEDDGFGINSFEIDNLENYDDKRIERDTHAPIGAAARAPRCCDPGHLDDTAAGAFLALQSVHNRCTIEGEDVEDHNLDMFVGHLVTLEEGSTSTPIASRRTSASAIYTTAHTASTSTRSRLTSAIAEPCDARVGSTGSFSSPRARGGADCTTSFCCANGQSHCGRMYRRSGSRYANRCHSGSRLLSQRQSKQISARACARARTHSHPPRS